MGTTGQSITLANSIIGVGILAMPFCFQQCGVLLATLIILFMGLISRLCCYFLLKSALLARRRNFEFLAFHVFGPAGKMAVEVGIIGFLMGTCIAYFVVVGDLGPQIIAKMFNINQSDILRTCIMVVVSLVCVLPLGLLRNVDSLSNVSAATICFYFCLVMKLIAEAASQLISGEWHSRVHLWRPAGMLQCVPIISMALFCQTQLFEIFESLPTLSLEKMNVVTKNAINICAGVYFTIGVFGYIAFCLQDISGNILMSLSPTMASDVIKLGFVMSLAFSFPLIIFPCRASLYSFLYKKVHSSHHDHIINHSIPETTFRCITVAIIAVALFISLLIPNIELVLGLVGSTIGVLICLVFPAACFVNITFKNTNERILAKGVIVLGIIIMVLGTYANLQAAENQIDRYDDKFITQERIDKLVEDFFQKQDDAGVYLKPADKKVPEIHKGIENVVNEVIIDSVVQPPNPVPPESNEKDSDKNIEQELKYDVKKLIVVPAVQQTHEKLPETHPKDLRTKLEAKMGNGAVIPQKESAEKPKEITQQNKAKIEVKQQKLMETIIQHGEEQKEILDEIIKTKKELQQNKKEADSNEAKKIAVESIKEIANMAIQSLGGVSEKPNQVKDEIKAERLEKLTNEAVQEIAKKAFETIEAIQEMKVKPEPPVLKVVNQVDESKLLKVPANIVNEQNNIQTNQKMKEELPVKPPVVQVAKQEAANAKSEPQQNVPDVVSGKSDVKPILNTAQATNTGIKNQPVNVQQQLESNKVKEQKIAQNVVPDTQKVNNAHLHSPDEPQSYKNGEDAQVKTPQETNIVQNVLNNVKNNNNKAKTDNTKVKQDHMEMNKDVNIVKVQSNSAQVKQDHVRKKRDIENCSQKDSLKSKDKELSDELVDRKRIKDSKEYLPSYVDMNSVALPKKIPLADVNILHHLSRTLKNYDKDER